MKSNFSKDSKVEECASRRVALAQAEDNRELALEGRVVGRGSSFESIIRSPADGTVLSRAVNPGDPVVPLTSFQPGTELAAVAEMKDLIFKGTVDEIDVGKMAVGLPARIKVGALPSDVVTGKVTRIAPQAQKKEGATLFDVEIALDPGQKIVLRAGYSANADVIMREKKDIPVIPERLVAFDDGGKKTTVEVPGATPKDKPRKVDVKLSGGEMQRVAIARSLAMGPDLILADEPTGNLDTSSGGDIMGLFQELWAQGRTVVVVTHDMALARRAGRLVEMRDGKITRDIPVAAPN